MIILIPVGLLLLASLAIFILVNLRPRYGTSWLIAAVASIFAWLTVFYMRLRLPTRLEILAWGELPGSLWGHFSLLIDYNAWPYALALITITLAVILTDAARTRYDSTPKSWSASLAIAALGLIAIQSGTSVTLMVTWALVDLLELFYLLGIDKAGVFNHRIVTAYGVRIASIAMLMLATAKNQQLIGTTDLTQIASEAGFLYLLAAGLRLGVFPLNLPFLQEPFLRRGVGNIIRLAPVAASLGLLARLPARIITPNLSAWLPLFHGMLSIAAIYAAIRWLTTSSAVEGRPYWIIAWAALAIASVINGVPNASLAWGIALLLPGSLLFLYHPRIQRMNFLMHFGLIGLIGLPFTPLASGWSGLLNNGPTFWTFVFLMVHALILLGYLKFTLEPGGDTSILESWARLVYPLGIIVIIQSIIALGLIGWPGSLTLGIWWLPAASILLILGTYYFVQRAGFDAANIKLPSSSGLTKVVNWILPRLEPIFRMEWVYQLLWWMINIINQLLRAFSIILEGEGGMLWTILLLVLMISLLTSLGGR
jgi:hypothetical protein